MEFGTPIDRYNNSKVSIHKLLGRSVKEGSFLVQNGPNKTARAKLLSKIDTKFGNIIKQLKPNEYVGSEQQMISILKNTPHIFLEIAPNTGFLGVNYPLGVQNTNLEPFGTDGNERAIGRTVFLTIDPKYISNQKLENLIIHELSHTLANHVKYRTDDHGKDFIAAEKLFKKIWTTYN
jgi:hypothetical protein